MPQCNELHSLHAQVEMEIPPSFSSLDEIKKLKDSAYKLKNCRKFIIKTGLLAAYTIEEQQQKGPS